MADYRDGAGNMYIMSLEDLVPESEEMLKYKSKNK